MTRQDFLEHEREAYGIASDATKRNAIENLITAHKKAIDILKARMLANENTPEIVVDLFRGLDEEEMPTCEVIAERLTKGDKAVNITPYGKWEKINLKHIPSKIT